jgi:YD repeat-containing protein
MLAVDCLSSLCGNIAVKTLVATDIEFRGPQVIRGIRDDDFLVNDDTTGGCDQSNPAVAIDDAGNFLVCLEDNRDGTNDIYVQRYDAAGTPVGEDFRVNDDFVMCLHSWPTAGMNGSGNFVICWYDERDGDNNIYAQRYDATGNPLGANFRVNDDAGGNWQAVPVAAMDPSGNFVISWHDTRNDVSDIYAQRFDATGTPVGTNFKVNDDPTGNSQLYPSLAMDNAGNSVICWHDDRDGNRDIYAQRYSAAGTPLGTNFKVNDDAGLMPQSRSAVAVDNSGNFVICWQDDRDFNTDIYAQRYDAEGNALGPNFRVDDDPLTSLQSVPQIAMNGTGSFIICWQDDRNTDIDVYAQRYDEAGAPQGTNFRVNDDPGAHMQNLSSVAMNNAGGSVICWRDSRDGEHNIYVQMYNAAGTPVGTNFPVEDEVGASTQYNPAAAMDISGDFVICWYDSRDGDPDIYAQQYNASGGALGANLMINDDAPGIIQTAPAIAMDNEGNFVICWQDYRDGDNNIYAQRYDAAGNPVGINFRVDNDPESGTQLSPSIAMNVAGGFIICWQDNRNSNYDIYAQRYDAAGAPLGTNFLVNDTAGLEQQSYPSTAMDGTGNFVICWQDGRDSVGDYNIYAQLYDTAGTRVGTNFLVNDTTVIEQQTYPSIAMDNAGNFVICWEDYRNGDGDVYAQRYDAGGNPVSTNFKVNDDPGTREQWCPSVTIDPVSGRFVICWTDQRDADGDTEIRAQLYENGNPAGANVQINEADLFPWNHQQSWKFATACNSDTLIFAWMDNRRHKSWDIYATLTDWSSIPVMERGVDHYVRRSELTAYPNPFRTYIRVYGTDSELKIYDVTGSLVGFTENGMWDGTDMHTREVQSGVYFFKTKSNVSHTPLKVIKLE